MLYTITKDSENYILSIAHTDKDNVELDLSKIEAKYLNCYKYLNGIVVLDSNKKAEMIAEAKAREEEELRVKEKEEHLAKILESVKVTREPSDKLGFDWLVYKLGEYVFLKEYVESESHRGTEDDPIPFELGLELIPNAFYVYNQELWVWMGARIIATEYPNEENFSWAKWL